MVSVFLPTRKGSERVKNKNTRNFAGVEGGLLRIKLSQLIQCKNISEIVLSTDDLKSIQVGLSIQDDKIKIVERPENLAISSTSLIDLVNYAPSVCNHETILWTHVTSPFVKQNDYDEILLKYFNQLDSGFDSLMTVKPIKSYIWDSVKNDIINRLNNEKWPRTQDLKPMYEIDSAVFLSSKNNYQKYKDRIGLKPYLFELDNIRSFDIDWIEDFELAEILFSNL